ncbi:PAS domain S-box-containing protein/diguanylate cyclase (GGDEF) domain-containing protein [Andreprevotia lacus DSM 23236]|uniref:PAS domain S-box-containing protein/diguanylate cyclase (GGDEF) domain-containing protein n=1 Tax=Andreprevotia lacus DSM 23236 TaxID=1121001 RepID=A0A1W1XMA2_9NEIS|nr:diguanylate cyclase [Andreprevotia lacus]SMC25083.1 PAS domain S-box-containing protein/diguanylate cyclase (GGDEF) domain-containing protein [Andreprevotia lacus DSM 23236]
MKASAWLALLLPPLVYCLAQWLGWLLAPAGQYQALFAPATGVAVWMVLVRGRRMLPLLAAGSLLLPLLHGLPWLAAGGLALLQTGQIMAIHRLAKRPHGMPLTLRFAALRVVLLPGLLSMLVAGLMMLVLGLAEHDLISDGWQDGLRLWAGGLLGVLALVPLALSPSSLTALRSTPVLRLLAALAVGAGVVAIIYACTLFELAEAQFLLFPLLIWSALRAGYPLNAGILLLAALAASVVIRFGSGEALQSPAAVLALLCAGTSSLMLAVYNRLLQRALKAQRMAAQVFESTHEGIVITDADAVIVSVNPAFSRITGYSVAEAIGKPSRIFDTAGKVREFNQTVHKQLQTTGMWQGETLDRRRNGELYPAWLSISAVHDDKGRVSNYVGVFSDYSDRKQVEVQLQALAHTDALTGLSNRVAMTEALTAAIAAARSSGEQLALFFLDLDGFKPVNDRHGHDVGDELLRVIAQRLRSSLKDDDVIARLGGDEFIILLDHVRDTDELAAIAQRLLAAVAQPVTLHETALQVGASIGIACYPRDAADAQQLLKAADSAMYQAKDAGKGQVCFHAPSVAV